MAAPASRAPRPSLRFHPAWPSDCETSDVSIAAPIATAGNELRVFAPDDAGGLALAARAASGGGLGSQGALALSGDGRFVFVVNAGSPTVSTFALGGRSLEFVSSVDAGGPHSISVTERDGIVVVLNDGGAGNVAAFRNLDGQLQAIADARRPLSAAGGTAPAQVSFSSDGRRAAWRRETSLDFGPA